MKDRARIILMALAAVAVLAAAVWWWIAAGRETTVSVDAFSASGAREDVTFTSSDPYATVTRQPDGALKVSGQRVGRQRIDLTSASGAKKSMGLYPQ